MFVLPTPHLGKLNALLDNQKLPQEDIPRVEAAIERYRAWVHDNEQVSGSVAEITNQLVAGLNSYRLYIDLDLIFDSNHDFLYRQKGQLKLDNTIVEEFMPVLVTKCFSAELTGKNLCFGPTTCFSGVRFESGISSASNGGGLKVKQKDQDFAISRKVYLKTSHTEDFVNFESKETNIAFVATECKTNLDKTMFQEAAATALEVRSAVPSAKYYLLCEWLDMTPVSTSTTAIEEILILRKAKRLSSNVRSNFSTVAGRQQHRQAYAAFLNSNPFAEDVFLRFITHVEKVITDSTENDVLTHGFF